MKDRLFEIKLLASDLWKNVSVLGFHPSCKSIFIYPATKPCNSTVTHLGRWYGSITRLPPQRPPHLAFSSAVDFFLVHTLWVDAPRELLYFFKQIIIKKKKSAKASNDEKKTTSFSTSVLFCTVTMEIKISMGPWFCYS